MGYFKKWNMLTTTTAASEYSYCIKSDLKTQAIFYYVCADVQSEERMIWLPLRNAIEVTSNGPHLKGVGNQSQETRPQYLLIYLWSFLLLSLECSED